MALSESYNNENPHKIQFKYWFKIIKANFIKVN